MTWKFLLSGPIREEIWPDLNDLPLDRTASASRTLVLPAPLPPMKQLRHGSGSICVDVMFLKLLIIRELTLISSRNQLTV
jgi:hypothetical protein